MIKDSCFLLCWSSFDRKACYGSLVTLPGSRVLCCCADATGPLSDVSGGGRWLSTKKWRIWPAIFLAQPEMEAFLPSETGSRKYDTVEFHHFRGQNWSLLLESRYQAWLRPHFAGQSGCFYPWNSTWNPVCRVTGSHRWRDASLWAMSWRWGLNIPSFRKSPSSQISAWSVPKGICRDRLKMHGRFVLKPTMLCTFAGCGREKRLLSLAHSFGFVDRVSSKEADYRGWQISSAEKSRQ